MKRDNKKYSYIKKTANSKQGGKYSFYKKVLRVDNKFTVKKFWKGIIVSIAASGLSAGLVLLVVKAIEGNEKNKGKPFSPEQLGIIESVLQKHYPEFEDSLNAYLLTTHARTVGTTVKHVNDVSIANGAVKDEGEGVKFEASYTNDLPTSGKGVVSIVLDKDFYFTSIVFTGSITTKSGNISASNSPAWKKVAAAIKAALQAAAQQPPGTTIPSTGWDKPLPLKPVYEKTAGGYTTTLGSGVKDWIPMVDLTSAAVPHPTTAGETVVIDGNTYTSVSGRTFDPALPSPLYLLIDDGKGNTPQHEYTTDKKDPHTGYKPQQDEVPPTLALAAGTHGAPVLNATPLTSMAGGTAKDASLIKINQVTAPVAPVTEVHPTLALAAGQHGAPALSTTSLASMAGGTTKDASLIKINEATAPVAPKTEVHPTISIAAGTSGAPALNDIELTALAVGTAKDVSLIKINEVREPQIYIKNIPPTISLAAGNNGAPALSATPLTGVYGKTLVDHNSLEIVEEKAPVLVSTDPTITPAAGVYHYAYYDNDAKLIKIGTSFSGNVPFAGEGIDDVTPEMGAITIEDEGTRGEEAFGGRYHYAYIDASGNEHEIGSEFRGDAPLDADITKVAPTIGAITWDVGSPASSGSVGTYYYAYLDAAKTEHKITGTEFDGVLPQPDADPSTVTPTIGAITWNAGTGASSGSVGKYYYAYLDAAKNEHRIIGTEFNGVLPQPDADPSTVTPTIGTITWTPGNPHSPETFATPATRPIVPPQTTPGTDDYAVKVDGHIQTVKGGYVFDWAHGTAGTSAPIRPLLTSHPSAVWYKTGDGTTNKELVSKKDFSPNYISGNTPDAIEKHDLIAAAATNGGFIMIDGVKYTYTPITRSVNIDTSIDDFDRLYN